MILAQTFSSDSEGWSKLVEALDAFGQESGLFSDVSVHRMGSKTSGPFQVNVKISGPHRNLMDVGYGVSQVLPILVDSITAPERTTFLIQQPEVHLHPKAQAELASFLCLQSRQKRHKFVIETHSDSVVDRIRMEVRAKDNLTAQDVALLYFERSDGGVVIHDLRIDDYGNIVNAPPGYRQFFLEEERRLLGS
jgi:predicted ATPase